MASSLISYASDLLGRSSKSQSNDTFQFNGIFVLQNDPTNGLEYNEVYIPEELWIEIFSNLNPSDILKCSLVCKNWHNIAKSNVLWQTMYNRHRHPKKAKNLPWYVFYCYFTTDNFKNLIKNGNGEEGFKHWTILENGGDRFAVEEEPSGAPELPLGVPEFHGYSSCFATSYLTCSKYQEINLKPRKLLRYIIRKYHPKIYASEWYTGRFDCASSYQLTILYFDHDVERQFGGKKSRSFLFTMLARPEISNHMKGKGGSKTVSGETEQFFNKPWEKLEICVEDYPKDIEKLCFLHEGKDNQFWAGRYGSKMAGGVLKFVFESIEPTEEDVDLSEDN